LKFVLAGVFAGPAFNVFIAIVTVCVDEQYGMLAGYEEEKKFFFFKLDLPLRFYKSQKISKSST